MKMADKKKYKSKEEIAKAFDLPERKSKIATILKQDQVYCICRSSDSLRFMICCDACEEWYHGDCIHITEKESKMIKQYFCEKCRAEDPTLKIKFRNTPSTQQSTSVAAVASSSDEKKYKRKEKPTSKRCGECERCLNKHYSCGNCPSCIANLQKYSAGRKLRCEQSVCLNHQEKKKEKRDKKEERKRRKRSVTPEIIINPALEGQRQCYGPGCTMTARPQSKYCSDKCGMTLATHRIYRVLPNRIQEFQLTESVATQLNEKALDEIRQKIGVVRATLAELDKRHKELDLLLEQAKRCELDPKALENNDVEDEMSMYCITCGHEIHSRTAVRHMEKCFNKYESQASFGSIFKTRIEGGNSMFCDFYNPASKTYCKRLKVLCPEHSKDPKVSETDICGCPLVKDVFQLTGEFCRAPKKSCFKHFCWEKIRRAEIDLERVRQWLKMDELIEQERQIRVAMASRAGVLGLMLHSTYDHELIPKLVGQQQQQQQQQQRN